MASYNLKVNKMFKLTVSLSILLLLSQLVIILTNKVSIKNLFIGILINLTLFTLLIKITLVSVESYLFLICFFFFIALDIVLAFVIILNKFYIKKSI